MTRLVKLFATQTPAEIFADAVSEQWGVEHGGVPLPRTEDETTAERGALMTGPWPRTERYAHVLETGAGQYAHVVDDYVQTLHGRTVRGQPIDVSDAVERDVSGWGRATASQARDLRGLGRGQP